MIEIALGILFAWILIVTIEWWLVLLIKIVCYGVLLGISLAIIGLIGIQFGAWA